MCPTADTRQTVCLPCVAASGTRQTINNILYFNPILFFLYNYTYLINPSFYVISLSNELHNVYYMFTNILYH